MVRMSPILTGDLPEVHRVLHQLAEKLEIFHRLFVVGADGRRGALDEQHAVVLELIDLPLDLSSRQLVRVRERQNLLDQLVLPLGCRQRQRPDREENGKDFHDAATVLSASRRCNRMIITPASAS